jgi:hypothetical protein
MDQSFFLRAKRLLEQRQPVRLDHAALVQAVKARQQASPTAAAAARCPAPNAFRDDDQRAITALILAEESWPRAAEAQAGCFNRAVAARPVNTRETRITGIFT